MQEPGNRAAVSLLGISPARKFKRDPLVLHNVRIWQTHKRVLGQLEAGCPCPTMFNPIKTAALTLSLALLPCHMEMFAQQASRIEHITEFYRQHDGFM